MTEEQDERRKGQRRTEERTACDIEARIELSDRLAVACRVKDLSEKGFKAQITDALHLPAEFDLLIPFASGNWQRHRVRMAWREDDMLGGEFITPPHH